MSSSRKETPKERTKTPIKERFYRKEFLAGVIGFAVGRKEETEDRHPMLRVHECLATICVATTKEVIACYIKPAPDGGRSKLYMSRNGPLNDAWEQGAKDYVCAIVDILAKMSTTSSKTDELQRRVYAYCKHKMEHRIEKFFKITEDETLEEFVSQPVEELFPHDKPADRPRLLGLLGKMKDDIKSLRRKLHQAGELHQKSKSCRELAGIWARNAGEHEGLLEIVRSKYPAMEKRMLKVASYSRSIDVLSEWAKRAGQYSEPTIKKLYPVPVPDPKNKKGDEDHIIYSEPSIKNAATVMGYEKIPSWAEIAQKYYSDLGTQHAVEELLRLNPTRPDLSRAGPPKELRLHAEMDIVQKILSLERPPLDVYIGISKLCCYHCIGTVNQARHLHIQVKGTHNTWLSPDALTDEELKTLEGRLHAINTEILTDPRKVKPGTEESGPVSTLPGRRNS